MPVLSGIDALRQIKMTVPGTKILMLTMHNNKQFLLRALDEGSSGYLLKDVTHEELIDAIRTVYKGGIALSHSIPTLILNTLVRQVVFEKEDDRKWNSLSIKK